MLACEWSFWGDVRSALAVNCAMVTSDAYDVKRNLFLSIAFHSCPFTSIKRLFRS
jgi:hypothetical protein